MGRSVSIQGDSLMLFGAKRVLKRRKKKNEMRFPGFSLEACQLLVSRGVSAIGIDTLSVDVGTSIDFPVHNFGLKKGLWDLFFFGCLLFEHFVKGLFFLENVAGLDQILANPGSYLCVVGAVKLKGG